MGMVWGCRVLYGKCMEYEQQCYRFFFFDCSILTISKYFVYTYYSFVYAYEANTSKATVDPFRFCVLQFW